MLHIKFERKRSKGRPRTRWIDQIRKGLVTRGENEILRAILEKKTLRRTG